MKACTKCGEEKNLGEFPKDKRARDGRGSWCTLCKNALTAQYRKKNRTKARELSAQWREENRDHDVRRRRKYRADRKREALEAYGGKCSCCGENETVFLAIDHVNGGGRQHRLKVGRRGGTSFYNWLRSEGWPRGFQVLCHNCNFAKHTLGECPHKIS